LCAFDLGLYTLERRLRLLGGLGLYAFHLVLDLFARLRLHTFHLVLDLFERLVLHQLGLHRSGTFQGLRGGGRFDLLDDTLYRHILRLLDLALDRGLDRVLDGVDDVGHHLRMQLLAQDQQAS
jgi:hypothetical protein